MVDVPREGLVVLRALENRMVSAGGVAAGSSVSVSPSAITVMGRDINRKESASKKARTRFFMVILQTCKNVGDTGEDPD